ncbi:PDZ domain-containing protein [Alteromonas sediminis]|nr:PDZ domain-containing protein [Alteromonas sediminis]
MNVKYAICLLAGLVSVSVQAKTVLERTLFLGVSPVTAEEGEGVEVQSMHPAGTGVVLGLESGDVIKAVNGESVADFSSLVNVLGKITEGQKLVVKVERDNTEVALTGKAQSRPKEAGEGYQVEYGEFDWQDNHIRTITYHPASPRKDKAAVMFIQGYTCGSIDYGMAPEITITQLLATYAQAGFTVFKMEKPGVGDSKGPLECSQIDFDTENAAFIAGLKHFASYDYVNQDNLFVFGHSLGVLHAGVIAEKGLVKGVMGYGGVLKSWYEYLQDIYAIQSVRYFGTSESQAKANVKTVQPFLDAWLNSDKSWESLMAQDDVKQAVTSNLLPIQGELVFQRHYSFFRSLNRYDFKALWSNSQSHALLLHGTYDIQAIDGAWAGHIAELINSNTDKTAQAEMFPRTEHALMRYDELADLQQAMREGENRAGSPGDKYNPDIALRSLAWMKTILQQH